MSESMSNVIELRKNVLEICDKCGTHQVISVLEINMANVDPFWGKCPNCGTSTRKVYDGNFLGGKHEKHSKGDGFQSPEEQFEDVKKWLKDCKETDPWEATERYLGIKNA